jgi:hypothetical protein
VRNCTRGYHLKVGWKGQFRVTLRRGAACCGALQVTSAGTHQVTPSLPGTMVRRRGVWTAPTSGFTDGPAQSIVKFNRIRVTFANLPVYVAKANRR